MNREPNALNALAYVGMKTAEYSAYAIILIALLVFWVMTP